ncbi:MAG TPA: LysM domain-containing protein, partial [Candidatus Sulfopaludibacter sp.]|nr:LysM domain-containing protein [Candidatus Sulfopaludibacter sp.]
RAARRAVMLARPGMARALRAAVAAAAAPASLTNWPPVPVAAPQTLTLYALPTFNKIPPSAGAAAADPAVNAVFLLAAPNSIPPSAQNRADRLMLAGDASSAPFNLLMEAMLSWAIYAITNPQPTQPPYTMPATVTADNLNQLQTLLKDPTTLGAAFDYTTLTNFLAANFTFNVSTIDSVNSETGVAVFPVFPAITLSDTANLSNGVNFSTPTVDDTYVTQVKAYFELLQVQFEQRNQSQQGATAAPAGTPTTSVAQLVYSQYFSMLMSAGVKSAIDLLASFPYTTPTGASINISTIAGNVGDTTLEGEPMRIVSPNQNLQVLQQGTGLTLSGVTHQIRAGETLANIGLAYQSLGGLDPSGNPYIPATLLGQNLGTAGIFNPSVAVPLANIAYTTQQYDSLNMICSMFLVRAGSPGSVNSLTGLTSMVQTLLGLNSSITSPTEVLAAGTTLTLPQSANYTTNQGDTITLVAAYLLETVQGATAVAAMVAALQKLNGGNVPVNPPADTALNIPPVSRTLSAADSVDSLAGLVLTTTNNVVGNLTALPAVIFTGATPPSGSNRYTTNAGDTLNILGARLLIQGGGQAAVNALTGLAAQVTAIEGLNPSIANPNAAISPGATIALPQSQTYTSVAGDTLTLIAAYTLDIAQDTADMALCLAALLPLNPTLKVTDPTQPQPAGTVLVMPVTASLLAAQGTLNVPLSYAIQQGDTFSGIATKFNQTLQDVATAATTLQNGAMPAVFAPGQNLTISDLASIGVPTLLADLLNQAEFNNASGMVSRFLLSGLRLPDPTDDLASLTAGHLQKLT